MLTISDGRSDLWQWDTGRTINVPDGCSQVHFSNKVFGRSIDVDVVGGVAIIPDILLQTDKELTAWAFVGTPENGYTKTSKSFKVNRRNKPADYVFTPTDQTTLDEIMERVVRVEESQDPDAIKNAVDEYLENNPIHVEETDPTVPEWAKQPAKPSYTAEEVGALPADTEIPEAYTLPPATADTLGGVKVGSGLRMDGDALEAEVKKEDVDKIYEEIAVVNVKKYGAVGDGVADDSDAIQTALNKGGIVYLPAGRYKITKTLTIGSNTTLMGVGDNSVIFLGDDDANLTPHFWYPAEIEPNYPNYYPYITTAENASRVHISRIRVEGNTETASANLHVGIAAESATDVVVDNVSVWKINYFPENAPPRPSGQYRTGWNIAFLRCNRAELANSTIQYGAYECVRVGPHSENVWVHDCLMEWGWRTGFQVIRGCDNILLERCTINQDDFDAYDTNACITLHPDPDAHIGLVTVRDCRINGELFTGSAGGAAISEVAYGVEDLVVEDTIVNVVADGLPALAFYGAAIVRRCKVNAETYTVFEGTASEGRQFVFEDSEFYANPPTNVPAFTMNGDMAMRRCKIDSSYDCIKLLSHNQNERYMKIDDCDLHVRNDANTILVWKSDGYGGVAFDFVGNTANNKFYLSQVGETINRKCTIADNTITPPASGGRGVLVPSTATTVYKLLHIHDNVVVQGSDAIKLNNCGRVVATGNEVSGCTNGITGTNENNVIEGNFD